MITCDITMRLIKNDSLCIRCRFFLHIVLIKLKALQMESDTVDKFVAIKRGKYEQVVHQKTSTTWH